jgi:RND family efflux transporter MFP subunit
MKNITPNIITRKYGYFGLFAMLLPCFINAAETISLVEVAQVESWDHGTTHTVHCEVATPNTYLLSSHNSARLKWALPEGTQVITGQLIAEQDGYYVAQSIERLKIELESADIEQSHSDSEYKRIRSLNEKNLVSPSHLNDMYRLLVQAKLSRKKLKQQLQELEHREKNLQHFSPVNGEILRLESQPGEYLADGKTILQLQPVDNKELICALPLKKYRQHSQLKNAKFTLDGSVELALDRSTLSLNGDSQTLALYLLADKTARKELLLGERLQVVVSYHSQNISMVPHDALELADDGYYVWRLNDSQRVKRLAVDIVSTQADYFLVKSPLLAGDQVVTFGKQGLVEKQQVELSLENHKEVSL